MVVIVVFCFIWLSIPPFDGKKFKSCLLIIASYSFCLMILFLLKRDEESVQMGMVKRSMRLMGTHPQTNKDKLSCVYYYTDNQSQQANHTDRPPVLDLGNPGSNNTPYPPPQLTKNTKAGRKCFTWSYLSNRLVHEEVGGYWFPIHTARLELCVCVCGLECVLQVYLWQGHPSQTGPSVCNSLVCLSPARQQLLLSVHMQPLYRKSFRGEKKTFNSFFFSFFFLPPSCTVSFPLKTPSPLSAFNFSVTLLLPAVKGQWWMKMFLSELVWQNLNWWRGIAETATQHMFWVLSEFCIYILMLSFWSQCGLSIRKISSELLKGFYRRW